MIDLISEKTNRADPEKEMIIKKPTYSIKDLVVIDSDEQQYTQEGKEFNRPNGFSGLITDMKYSLSLKKWYYDVKVTAHCYIIDIEESALSLKQ